MNVVPVDSDRQIAYAEYGRPDGAPVVFLHGTPGSRRLGALLGTAARENGVRVLAPDRPGYGRSSPWPNRSVSDAAELVTPVLDDADVQTAGLIAFSGGGPYALSIAATQAEEISQIDVIAGATPRPSARTSCDTATSDGFGDYDTICPPGTLPWTDVASERLDPSFVVGQYTANDDAVPDAAAEIVTEDFVEAFARHRSGAVTEFHNTATDWGIGFDEIDAEVRLWHGSNDTNVPIAGARRLERKIPSAELHVLDDADHLQTLLRSIPDVLEGYR